MFTSHACLHCAALRRTLLCGCGSVCVCVVCLYLYILHLEACLTLTPCCFCLCCGWQWFAMWSLVLRSLAAASCVCVRIESLLGVCGWSLVFASNGRLFEVSACDR